MKQQFQIPAIHLLSNTLESRMFDLPEKQGAVLIALYNMKKEITAYSPDAAPGFFHRIGDIDKALQEVLAPALVEDPSVFKDEDVIYAMNGHHVKFKIDTGTKGVVVDARNIQWNEMYDEEIRAAHLAYADVHPNSGNVTKEKLTAFSTDFKNIDFGRVSRFDLALHEGKDDKEYKAVTLQGPFPVVAVSRPKNSSGKRSEEMRPVIHMTMQRQGFDEKVLFPVNLVARKELTRRGLLGKDFLEDKKIIYGKQDTRVLDFNKLDFCAVTDVLKPYMR